MSTATPNSAMNPIPADMLNGIPLRYRAHTPPMADNGIDSYSNTIYARCWKTKSDLVYGTTEVKICDRSDCACLLHEVSDFDESGTFQGSRLVGKYTCKTYGKQVL